jgi:hypothetical protein
MLLKKDMLLKLIEEDKITSFTIVGVPSQELVETYFNRKDLVEFLKSKNIECNIFEFDRTDIGIYFPSVGRKQYTDVCSISVTRKVTEEEYKTILNLFDEVLDYYQASVPPRVINKILNLYENESFVFNDMLMLIKDDQSEIARKINKSRQVISDMKSGKCKANIVVVALLMKEYPLLPWTEFISGFINE